MCNAGKQGDQNKCWKNAINTTMSDRFHRNKTVAHDWLYTVTCCFCFTLHLVNLPFLSAHPCYVKWQKNQKPA